MNKVELRAKYAANTKIDDEQNKLIVGAAAALIGKYEHIHLIGIYLPLPGEVDLSSLMIEFPEIKFAVPKIRELEMFYVNYYLGAELRPNKVFEKYYEPTSNTEAFPKLVFVPPGVAFDIRGYRLGRGKGHYDRYFAKRDVTKIGVCASSNLVLELPNEWYDQRMNHIITENLTINL